MGCLCIKDYPNIINTEDVANVMTTCYVYGLKYHTSIPPQSISEQHFDYVCMIGDMTRYKVYEIMNRMVYMERHRKSISICILLSRYVCVDAALNIAVDFKNAGYSVTTSVANREVYVDLAW